MNAYSMKVKFAKYKIWSQGDIYNCTVNFCLYILKTEAAIFNIFCAIWHLFEDLQTDPWDQTHYFCLSLPGH